MAEPKKSTEMSSSTGNSGEASRVAPTFPARPDFVIKATGDEARNYDFAAARVASGLMKTTNVIETVGNLVKACLGGGVVGIHSAYKKCGLITGLAINILAGMMLIHSKYILVSSAQTMYGRLKMPFLTYPDLAEAVFKTGPFPKLSKRAYVFRYMVDTTICINLFGSCAVYSVIVARTIKQILEEAKLVGGGESIRIYIVCMIIPCILIAMILTLKYLAPFSIVGNLMLIIVAFSTIYYGLRAATKSPTEFPYFKNAEGFFEFLGVCIFSMEGMGMTVPIENHMREPRKFPMVLCIAMSFVIVIVAIIGFFGYWGFGENASTPITMNFPWEPYPIMLKCSLGLVVYVTFALNLWAPVNLVWCYIKVKHNPDKYWCWERVYRAIIVVVLILMALSFPNIDAFMGFIGSFGVGFSGFVYPASIELTVKWNDPGLGVCKWRVCKFAVVFIFGLFLCLLGGYCNVKNMAKTEG